MTLKPEHIVEALNKKTFDEIDPDFPAALLITHAATKT